MSYTTTQQTAFLVNILGAEGEETGRAVLVYLDYLLDVDASYGADADGRRGAPRVEYDILDVYIETGDLLTMTSAEVEQVLADARRIFSERNTHF